jgi:serine protease Do
MKSVGLAVVLVGLLLGENLVAQTYSMGGSFLGVGVAEITTERAKALKLKEERGVEITSVSDDSPAAKAGLKVGDVVLEYNGQRIEGTQQFVRMVRETPDGRQTHLVVSRDGATQTLTATVAGRKGMEFPVMPDMERLQQQLRMRVPDIPRPYIAVQSGGLGVEAESLTGQLAEYFGVKEGVLVRSVLKDSVAEKAGVKAGDVITKVGDTKVTAPREITNAIRAKSPQKTFPVIVVRDHKEMNIAVTLNTDQSERIRTVSGTEL